jgi:two-component system LytT family response regulator
MLSALIVDDEALARARLRRLLQLQDVNVIGEAETAAEARTLIADLRPDLLLVDVQMPGASGIELGRELADRQDGPQVIFVTGYSEYAVEAFEQNALDYLLKPVSAHRLTLSLDRARDRIAARLEMTPDPSLSDIEEGTSPIDSGNATPARLRSLPVRANFAVRFLPISDVLCVVAHDKKVYACTRGREYRTLYTLTQLESMLPEDQFLRIHESSTVNLDAIVQLDFLGDHAYEVCLLDNRRLRVGRTRYAELQRRMGLAAQGVGGRQ